MDKAANADKLDNKDSTDFYAAGSTVADSEKLDGLDSTNFAAYKRTVVVSPVGTDAENGQALLDAISGITDASASKPYLIHIEPATYDLGNGSLSMKEWVDIEGSGEINTVITSAVFGNDFSACGTVEGANNAEMRFLAVRNTGRGTGLSCASAIHNFSASPRLTHVTAVYEGAASLQGAVLNFNSSPIMTSVTATAPGRASFGNIDIGVGNFDNSRPTMTDTTATAGIGVYITGGSSPTIKQSSLRGGTQGLALLVDSGTSAKVALTQVVGLIGGRERFPAVLQQLQREHGPGNLCVGSRPFQEKGISLALGPGLLRVPALLLALIHRSAWNRNSTKLAAKGPNVTLLEDARILSSLLLCERIRSGGSLGKEHAR